MSIECFECQSNSRTVQWVSSSGGAVSLKFDHDIYALKLRDADRVVVLELVAERDNATIHAEDGAVLHRVSNPDPNALCFGDVFYVNDELTLISRRRDASMTACVIDEEGTVLRTYETR